MNVKYSLENVDDREYNGDIAIKLYILGETFIEYNKEKCLNK